MKTRVEKKSYTYREVTGKSKANCTFVYQIIDTETAQVLKTDELKRDFSDKVFSVNWNNHDRVKPSELYSRLTKRSKFKQLDTAHFDSRMELKGKWEMYNTAINEIAAEIVQEGTTFLSDYRPSAQRAQEH